MDKQQGLEALYLAPYFLILYGGSRIHGCWSLSPHLGTHGRG